MRPPERDRLKAFYDRFGRRQDAQAFYEDVALEELIRRGDFGSARALLELACGTGRLAERLLDHELPPEAVYRAFELSETMIALSGARLARFGDRAEVTEKDVTEPWDLADGTVDRVVATYIIDILSDGDAARVVDEAHRVLAPGGLLCTACLTHGSGPVTKLVELIWRAVHRLNRFWVGGCRPISLMPYLDETRWRLRHRCRLARFGLISEVVVVERR